MATEPTRARLEWLRKHFRGEAAEGLRATWQFDLSGPTGGSFWARVQDGRLEVGAGETAAPDVRIRAAASDYDAVLAGRENPELLFMAGRVEVAGDRGLALRVRRLFRRSE